MRSNKSLSDHSAQRAEQMAARQENQELPATCTAGIIKRLKLTNFLIHPKLIIAFNRHITFIGALNGLLAGASAHLLAMQSSAYCGVFRLLIGLCSALAHSIRWAPTLFLISVNEKHPIGWKTPVCSLKSNVCRGSLRANSSRGQESRLNSPSRLAQKNSPHPKHLDLTSTGVKRQVDKRS